MKESIKKLKKWRKYFKKDIWTFHERDFKKKRRKKLGLCFGKNKTIVHIKKLKLVKKVSGGFLIS